MSNYYRERDCLSINNSDEEPFHIFGLSLKILTSPTLSSKLENAKKLCSHFQLANISSQDPLSTCDPMVIYCDKEVAC